MSCRLPELPQFLFLSSIAAVSRLENLLHILKHAAPATVVVGSGYGGSKWVVEVLLIEAIARNPLHVVVVRSRQVSGGLDGYCNSSDWLSSMMQSASSVKCLPLTSTKMVSTCRSCGTVPRNVSHVANHSHHPAEAGRRYLLYPWMFLPRQSSTCEIPPTKILHLAHPLPYHRTPSSNGQRTYSLSRRSTTVTESPA